MVLNWLRDDEIAGRVLVFDADHLNQLSQSHVAFMYGI